jgi:shikimate kinase
MEWMNHHGMTVWINPPEAVICERLKKEAATRPLLANLDEAALTDFIHERMADRIPFYAMASTTITDPHISMEEFLNAIQNAKNIF